MFSVMCIIYQRLLFKNKKSAVFKKKTSKQAIKHTNKKMSVICWQLTLAEPGRKRNYTVVGEKSWSMGKPPKQNSNMKARGQIYEDKWALWNSVKECIFWKSPVILRLCQTIIGTRKHLIYKISRNSPLSLQLYSQLNRWCPDSTQPA